MYCADPPTGSLDLVHKFSDKIYNILSINTCSIVYLIVNNYINLKSRKGLAYLRICSEFVKIPNCTCTNYEMCVVQIIKAASVWCAWQQLAQQGAAEELTVNRETNAAGTCPIT